MFIGHIFQYYCYITDTSFHFETLFSTQPINLVVEEISRNKSVIQTPITYFINQKEKHVSMRHNSILTLMKWGTIFPHWYNVHDLSWCEVFFCSLSQYLLWQTCCKNYAYNDETFLCKEVTLLSVQRNL